MFEQQKVFEKVKSWSKETERTLAVSYDYC